MGENENRVCFLFVLVFLSFSFDHSPARANACFSGGYIQREKKENQARKGLITPRLRAIIGEGVCIRNIADMSRIRGKQTWGSTTPISPPKKRSGKYF